MTIINLTPHEIVLPDRTLPPDGRLPRCSEITSLVGTFEGIDLIVRSYGEVDHIPEPEEGILYIVSMLVRLALPGRKDLASPGDLVRDKQGKIIGGKNLVVNR